MPSSARAFSSTISRPSRRSITSAATLKEGDKLQIGVAASSARKCERCWHWRDDVGHDAAHPDLCGRCTSNLHGAGEPRSVA